MPKRTLSHSVDVFVEIPVAGWRRADASWKLIEESREHKIEAVR